MKKYFLLILALVFLGLSVNAQTATLRGHSMMPGIDYYNHGSKTGHLVFHNNTGRVQTHMHVVVSVTVYETVKIGGIPIERKKKELILCDDYFDIPVGDSQVDRGPRGEIKGGPEKEGKEYIYHVKFQAN